MQRFAAVALLMGLAAASIGCGGDHERAATDADAVELSVFQVWDESVGLYVEGARSFIAVETPAGDELLELELTPTARGAEQAVRLDPGDYRLLSWQRPSAGGGDVYDPPTDRCSAPFTVAAGTPVVARIEVRAAQGCTIAFE
jgi:hypothetical protein